MKTLLFLILCAVAGIQCVGQSLPQAHSAQPDTLLLRYWLLHRAHHKRVDTLVRYPSSSLPNTISIRGKALPIFFLALGVNFSIGAEYGFGKVHAIGLDAGYTNYNTERERYDSASASYKSAPRITSVIRGVMLSYRRYLRVTNWNGSSYRTYGSVFFRAGNENAYPEDGYDGSVLEYSQRELSVGGLYGVLLPYEINGLCVDMSIGPFWKWKTIHDVERNGMGTTVVSDSRTNNFGVRVGLNVAFVYGRVKK